MRSQRDDELSSHKKSGLLASAHLPPALAPQHPRVCRLTAVLPRPSSGCCFSILGASTNTCRQSPVRPGAATTAVLAKDGRPSGPGQWRQRCTHCLREPARWQRAQFRQQAGCGTNPQHKGLKAADVASTPLSIAAPADSLKGCWGCNKQLRPAMRLVRQSTSGGFWGGGRERMAKAQSKLRIVVELSGAGPLHRPSP